MCKRSGAILKSRSLNITATIVAGLFFPAARWIGVEPDSQLSPRMMQKAIHASVSASGFVNASIDLKQLAEVDISARRLGRLVERIGNERVAQVQQEASAYQSLPLPAQQVCPIEMAPDVVCVQCDGGRMQLPDSATTE